MFNIQEQEQWEYEAGMDTEERNAFAVSRLTTPIVNERPKLQRWLAAGMFVAVSEAEVYCRFTDAILGAELKVIGVARTHEAALRLLPGHEEGEGFYVVDPQVPAGPAPKAAVPVKKDRRRTFVVEGREEGRGPKFVKKFRTLAEAGEYVQARWQGWDYADGDAAFHSDYVAYVLKGFTLAEVIERVLGPCCFCGHDLLSTDETATVQYTTGPEKAHKVCNDSMRQAWEQEN